MTLIITVLIIESFYCIVITGFKGNKPATLNIAASLPDELDHFYARFEAHNTAHTESASAAAAEEVSPLSISVVDVTRFFKRVNIRKAVIVIIRVTENKNQ